MEISNCPICTFPLAQTKCLLFSIKKKLHLLLNEYVPDFNEQEFKESRKQFSFVQLLKIVFGDKYCSNSFIQKCNHDKICRYLKRKFKCDSKTFQQLCDQLALKIGQKNFHFQILANQIKSLGQTSIEYSLIQQKNQKQGQKTKETIQGIQQQKMGVQNDIENAQNHYQIYNYNQSQLNKETNLQLPYFYPYSFYFPQFPPNPDNKFL